MRKGYKLLSADHATAIMVADAILKLRKIRVYTKRPDSELFHAFTEGIGTQAEASRIIEFLIDDRVIIKDGNRYKWNGDINLWDDIDRRRSYVLAMLLHSDDTKKPVLCEKKSVKVTIPAQSPVNSHTEKTFNLQELSDDELTNIQFEIQKEFEYRAAIREKQARLQQVLDLAEMSKEELLGLLECV